MPGSGRKVGKRSIARKNWRPTYTFAGLALSSFFSEISVNILSRLEEKYYLRDLKNHAEAAEIEIYRPISILYLQYIRR